MKELIKNIWQSPKSSLAGLAIIAVILLLVYKVITVEDVTILAAGIGSVYALISKDKKEGA